MAGAVTVRELTEVEYGAWNALVAQSPDGSIYSTPDYLDLLCRVGGGRFRVLGVYRGEELSGGIALYERDSRFGTYVTPRLLLYYLGPVLARYDTKHPSLQTSRQVEVLSALAHELRDRRYGRVELRWRSPLTDARPFLVAGWHSHPGYTYVVPLSDVTGLWERMEQNLRRLVKRCEKEGLTFTEDDDFASFYRLHAMTMQRKDTSRYLSEEAFGRYFSELGAKGWCRLMHARLPNGRSVATELVLTWSHPVCHTVSAAADPEYLKLGASTYLRWHGFVALSAMGYEGTDLTDAALNQVTHFKAQLGGDLVLTLVLESGPRPVYLLGTKATRLARRLQGAAGRVGRALLRRGT